MKLEGKLLLKEGAIIIFRCFPAHKDKTWKYSLISSAKAKEANTKKRKREKRYVQIKCLCRLPNRKMRQKYKFYDRYAFKSDRSMVRERPWKSLWKCNLKTFSCLGREQLHHKRTIGQSGKSSWRNDSTRWYHRNSTGQGNDPCLEHFLRAFTWKAFYLKMPIKLPCFWCFKQLVTEIPTHGNNPSNYAKRVRDKFKEYFNNEAQLPGSETENCNFIWKFSK